jgi:hypothetical protein
VSEDEELDLKRRHRASYAARRLRHAVFVSRLLVFLFALPTTLVHAGEAAETARVIPDTGGPIAEITLHFLAEAAADLEATYCDLFASLPPDVSCQVLCSSAAEAREFLYLWGADASAGGRCVNVINVNQPLTIWARDRRIARHDSWTGEPASSIVPASVPDYSPDKDSEILVPCLLADGGWIPGVVETDVHVEGGNIVSNERRVFIGANVWHEN